jgi:hypothetical protein
MDRWHCYVYMVRILMAVITPATISSRLASFDRPIG